MMLIMYWPQDSIPRSKRSFVLATSGKFGKVDLYSASSCTRRL